MLETLEAGASRRIAVLIDGDNAQPALVGHILAEAGKYGLVTIRRVYGDWTTPNMSSWKETLHLHAIHPIQQFRNTTGKNATDSALIIDAMDILHEGVVNAFCLVSSDSDFTRLATRIREKGLFVMGIGREDTPRAFVKACEVFAYTENLAAREEDSGAKKRAKKAGSGKPSELDPLPLLEQALDMAAQEDGWAFLANVGNCLRQLDPGFDPRTYGCKQLSQLVRQYPSTFDVSERKTQDGSSHIYVRLQQRS